jgi:hypothetical protein
VNPDSGPGGSQPGVAELQQQIETLREQLAALRAQLDAERQNRAFVVTVEGEIVSEAGSFLQTTIRELVADLLASPKYQGRGGEDWAIWRRRRLLAVIRRGGSGTPEVTIF